MTIEIDLDAGAENRFTDEAWTEVLSAVDVAYSKLVTHQALLEEQNEKLHEFRRFLGSILSSVSDILIVVGRGGVIEEVSRSLLEATGLCSDDLIGKPATALFAGAGADRVSAELEKLRHSRAPVRFEASLRAADASEVYEISVSARNDDRGRPIGAVIIGRPLGELRRAYSELEASHTSLKEAQSQLVRNEKLASLGRLLAGVAHELNNPISFVYANAHALEKYVMRFEEYFDRVENGASRDELVMLREKLKLDRELKNLRSAIDGARDGAERVRDIVADLRRLSVAGAQEREWYDLVEAARVAARWVVRGSKAQVDIRFEGATELQIHGNPGHIQQIVMNLLQNGLDALQGQKDPVLVLRATCEGDMAVLTVCDNGPGVPEDIAASIFDPFFTTKPVGHGTGLGLAISSKIAQEHGGTLSHFNLDPGSCFRLELPMEAPR